MYIEIVTPDKQLFAGEVKLVNLPGTKGSFEILKNHAPLISTLTSGEIKVVDTNDQRMTFSIGGGVIETSENNIIVLVES